MRDMNKQKMTDKERILLHTCRELSRELWGARLNPPLRDRGDGIQISRDWVETPKVGDLVAGTTCRIHKWVVGYVAQVISHDTLVIREIGSNELCTVWNEDFLVIRNLPDYNYTLLEGDQRVVYEKVQEALRRFYKKSWINDEFRFAGISFPTSNTATVTMRQKWEDTTFNIDLSIPNRRYSIKKILEQMLEKGLGDKSKFVKVEADVFKTK